MSLSAVRGPRGQRSAIGVSAERQEVLKPLVEIQANVNLCAGAGTAGDHFLASRAADYFRFRAVLLRAVSSRSLICSVMASAVPLTATFASR